MLDKNQISFNVYVIYFNITLAEFGNKQFKKNIFNTFQKVSHKYILILTESISIKKIQNTKYVGIIKCACELIYKKYLNYLNSLK